jgi:hypothetical protein
MVLLLRCGSLFLAHRDERHLDAQPSLSGHCGRGRTCSLSDPVANDPNRKSAALAKGRVVVKWLSHPLTHPRQFDCRGLDLVSGQAREFEVGHLSFS